MVKDSKGEYKSGTQLESRNITLSHVAPVLAPKGKDLFDQWTDEDWQDVDDQNKKVFAKFTETLDKTSAVLAENTAVINTIESKNEKLFQERKKAQEEADSFLKDMLVAFATGGMAGVKAALKSKVEDKINMELAKAFVQATGGSEDQIAAMSQAMSFMRGKVQERKIKSTMAKNTITTAVGTMAAVGMTFATGGLAGGILAAGVMTGNPAGAGIAIGGTTAAYRAVAGNKKADAFVNKVTGPKDQLAQIQSTREGMIQSNITQAVAKSTGLPSEVIGNIITDYKGAKAAKKVRDAVNGNPIANIGSQVVGVVGGIYKTALVATGIPERDIAKAISDGNRMAFSANTNTTLEAQSLAYLNQAAGMSAPGTSYTSATPTLKDKKGLIKELGQRKAVDLLSEGMSADEKELMNVAFRGMYGKIEQKKADKKAQSAAVRSTVTTAVTTAITMGAAGALGPGFQGAMSTIGAGSAEMGAAIVKMGVQVVDGSRNGLDGMAAGFVNGAIGMIGVGSSGASEFLKATGMGIGVSYNKNDKWGASIGYGGSGNNVGISFSQRGDTSIKTGMNGINLSYNLSKQSYGVGFTANAGNGLALTANYDSKNGLSSTASFNKDGVGTSITVDRHGTSASMSLSGISLGTNGPNGFTPAEIDWVEQNLDQARGSFDAKMAEKDNAAQDTYLRDNKVSEAEIAGMTPEQRNAKIHELAKKNDNDPTKNKAVDTSRTNPFSKFIGGFTDAAANMFNFHNGKALSSESMYVDADGGIHPRTCFTAGTKVHTLGGTKVIEDIRVGDVVLSWNEDSGEKEYKTVTELFLHEVELLYELSFQRPNEDSLVSLVDEAKIKTTWNHPFWVVDKQAWIEARHLKAGDKVLLSSGKEVAISGTRSYNVEATKVYNFEVEDNHTYFVGEDGVLVHNYVFVIPVIGAGIMKCAQNAACSRAVATGTAVLGTAVSGIFSGNTVHRAEGEENKSKDQSQERNSSQDKVLTKNEIKKLKKAGEDPHVLKGKIDASKRDLYKDKDGNIWVKPKGGKGSGEPTGININEL
jgi:hypothetical protein